MANVWYFFTVRDTGAGQGAPVPGLKPDWASFRRIEDNAELTPRPAILEIARGAYKFQYDPERGDAAGQVDVLAGVTPAGLSLTPGDRYVDVFATREPSRLLAAVNPQGQVTLAPTGLDAVPVEDGVNAREALAPILAASAGVLTGAGTGQVAVRGGNSKAVRIAASTDNAGNRTAVVLTLPPRPAG